MRTVQRSAVVGLAGLGLLLAATGCVAPGAPAEPSTPDAGPSTPVAGPSTPDADPSTPAPAPDLTAIGVELRQDRASWGPRVVQVHVTYDGPGELTVLGAVLDTPVVAGPASSDPEVHKTVPSGSYRDVDLPLGAPVCEPGDGAATAAEPTSVPATVTLSVLGADGAQSLRLTPTDPNHHLPRIHAEDCAAATFATAASVELGTYRTEQGPDQLLALVDLTVRQVPGGPPVAIDQVDQSILFQPVGAATSWAFPTLVPVTATTTVTLTIRPGRCDPHAVADDKRGTFLGLRTTVDGEPQHVFYVQLPEPERGRLKDFIGESCGWGD